MKRPHGYKFRNFEIPEYMGAALERYVRSGVLPGHFLRAVIANDFVAAISRADDTNVQSLPAYVGWFHNEAPSGCWGSTEKLLAWCEHGGMEGQNSERFQQGCEGQMSDMRDDCSP